jgi:hypothetical protein
MNFAKKRFCVGAELCLLLRVFGLRAFLDRFWSGGQRRSALGFKCTDALICNVFRVQTLCAIWLAVAPLCLFFTTSACAVSDSYIGINSMPNMIGSNAQVSEHMLVQLDTLSTKAVLQTNELTNGQERAYRELTEHHGYQPIFNGLKFRQGSWEERITSEAGARFINKDMVLASLSLIVEPNITPIKGHTANENRIQALCESLEALPAKFTSSHARLFGLCALDRCYGVKDQDWENYKLLLRRTLSNQSSEPISQASNTVHDAIFIARAAVTCGQVSVAKAIVKDTNWYFSKLRHLSRACLREKCSEETLTIIRSGRPAVANAILAASHVENVTAPIINEAGLIWRIYEEPTQDIINDNTDMAIQDLCVEIGIIHTECRNNFPYSIFLERKFLDFVSHNISNKNFSLTEFINKFSDEINYRSISIGSQARKDVTER